GSSRPWPWWRCACWTISWSATASRCRWLRAGWSRRGGGLGPAPAARSPAGQPPRAAERVKSAANPKNRPPVKILLQALVNQGIEALRAAGTIPADAPSPDFVIERPKTREHGDFATNAAMLMAKTARTNPRALAQALVAALPASDDVARVEIAGPGFINFHLAPGAWQREVAGVLRHGDQYGRNSAGAGRTAGVEYVSANPTGPLHVGHGRAAAIGDCIARVLDANGWKV